MGWTVARRHSVVTAALLVASSGAAIVPASAQTRPVRRAGATLGTNVVEPTIYWWLRSRTYRRFRSGTGAGASWAEGATAAPVTIRLDRAASTDRLLSLEGRGLRLGRCGDALCRIGSVVTATVTETALRRLAAEPSVVRVELDVLPPSPPPLDGTAFEIGAPRAWATNDDDGASVTGRGVVIADIDTGIDVFHPMFFRADGGYHAWIDVDGDGVFTPGTDAVDLDGDGEADEGETLRFFDGLALGYDLEVFDWGPMRNSDDGAFDVGWDHLYADANDNGRRDFGPPDGYFEEDPTYGERLFLVDDADGDRVVDLGEKLVALGTSKIRAVRGFGTVYERGEDLIDAPSDSHGTGVTGILAGGTRGMTTLTGVAPDAEIVVAVAGRGLSEAFAWSVLQGAKVVLHEYAPWTTTHLDGSTNHEQMMDEAAFDGVAQVTPAGNLGGAGKHAIASVAPRESATIGMIVPESSPGETYRAIQVDLHWRSPERNLELEVIPPSGPPFLIGPELGGAEWEGGELFAVRDDSTGGTADFEIFLQNRSGLEAGEWTLTLHDPDDTPLDAPAAPVSAYVSDSESGWSEGVRFDDEHVSERHLVCFPATADSGITVAAYAGHDEDGYYQPRAEPAGHLRGYSGRGTRLDGASILDVAAPDNPLTAAAPDPVFGGLNLPQGSFIVFGGTSGAGPHVAGAAALLAQIRPELDGYEVMDAIRTGALVDNDVVPEDGQAVADLWGAGKLRIYETLYGEPPARNRPPTIAVEPVTAVVGQPTPLVANVGDEEDAVGSLAVRWDVDYDGTWEVGPLAPSVAHEITFDEIGTWFVRVQVTDTGGLTAGAVATVTVVADEGGGDAGPDAGGDAGIDTPQRAGGCSCDTSAGGRPAAAGAVLLAALLAVRRRRLLATVVRRRRTPHERWATAGPDSSAR